MKASIQAQDDLGGLELVVESEEEVDLTLMAGLLSRNVGKFRADITRSKTNPIDKIRIVFKPLDDEY